MKGEYDESEPTIVHRKRSTAEQTVWAGGLADGLDKTHLP